MNLQKQISKLKSDNKRAHMHNVMKAGVSLIQPH